MEVSKEPGKKSYADQIVALKKEAQSNKVFNAVCYAFALRKRTRQQITIPGLRLKMKKEGFEFSSHEYEKVLQTLASMGFGTLVKTPEGKIKALVNIKVTLQSIGQIAVAKRDVLEARKAHMKFEPLKAGPKQVIDKPQVIDVRPVVDATSITAQVNGRPITFTIPSGLSLDELTNFLWKFNEAFKTKKDLTS